MLLCPSAVRPMATGSKVTGFTLPWAGGGLLGVAAGVAAGAGWLGATGSGEGPHAARPRTRPARQERTLRMSAVYHCAALVPVSARCPAALGWRPAGGGAVESYTDGARTVRGGRGGRGGRG